MSMYEGDYDTNWARKGRKGSAYDAKKLPDVSEVEEVKASFDKVFYVLDEEISSVENWHPLEQENRFWNKNYPGLSVCDGDNGIEFNFRNSEVPYPETDEFIQRVCTLVEELNKRERQVLFDTAKRNAIWSNEWLVKTLDKAKADHRAYIKTVEERTLEIAKENEKAKKKSWLDRLFWWLAVRNS